MKGMHATANCTTFTREAQSHFRRHPIVEASHESRFPKARQPTYR